MMSIYALISVLILVPIVFNAVSSLMRLFKTFLLSYALDIEVSVLLASIVGVLSTGTIDIPISSKLSPLESHRLPAQTCLSFFHQLQ